MNDRIPDGERIATQAAEIDQLRKDVADLKGTVEALRDVLLQARGGLRILLLIGSLLGVLAGGPSAMSMLNGYTHGAK